MTKLALVIAATLTFGTIFWVILTEIGKKTDVMRAPPSFHAKQAKLILPLMAVFVSLIFLASQAESWGWP
ncbi:hypothetical protein [Rhizobium leguminosarum]|uniref:hypothetical protein n=1 Tax=Rhizobium leguminosarum TaxID=384 RepID=UPI001C923DCE|nr:hypothetical protein [Rhizobium leguminosarum]MBY2947024.1 hypothetical protein [Rhizobium leguminosarum]